MCEIHSDGAEGRRQIVEAIDQVIRRGYPCKQQLDLLPVIECSGCSEAAPEAELQMRRICAGIGFAANVPVREVRRSEQRIPVERCQQRRQRVCIEARCERPSDEAAHAGPCHQIDRDAMLFEPPDDPDMGETARAAAAEGNADSRPRQGRVCRDDRRRGD